MSFAENLKNAREKKGISQSELARRIGISRSVISNYEAGKRTNIIVPVICSLASALDCTWQELVAGTEFQTQVAKEMDGHMLIKAINGQGSLNGQPIENAEDAFREAHKQQFVKLSESMTDDEITNVLLFAESFMKMDDRAKWDIVRVAKDFAERHPR